MRAYEVNQLMRLNFEFCTRYNEEIDVLNESGLPIIDPDGESIEYEPKHIDMAFEWDTNLEHELPTELRELKDCLDELFDKGMKELKSIRKGNRTLLEVIKQKNKQIESLRCDVKTLQATIKNTSRIDNVETSRTVGSDTESQWLALWSR